MSISFSGSTHNGPEIHHYYRQDTAPTSSDPLQVGDLWSDTTSNLLKRCTSLSPVTFVSVEGGSSAHDLFSATHGDVDDLDTPADNDVLTYDSVAAKWSAEAASGHGDHHRGVKAIAIEDPAGGDNLGGVFFDRAATISQVNHTRLGGTNVVYNIHHATSRDSGTPNKLWTTDKTVTSESGEEFTSFDDATIPAGSYVWWSIASVAGTPTRFESSFEYTED